MARTRAPGAGTGAGTLRPGVRALALVALVVSFAVGLPAPARADGVNPSSDLQIAQTVGGMELTVIIRRTQDVPGPLYVDLIAHRPNVSMTIDMTVRSATDGRAPTGRARIEAGTEEYPVVLRVYDVGPHTLELRAAGEVSVLPFRVVTASVAGWELLVYGGFAGVGVLVLAVILVVAMAGRRARVPAAALGGTAVVLLVVAITVALLSSQLPQPVPAGAPPPTANPGGGAVVTGLAYAEAAFATEPARVVPGTDFTLRLALSDGATGWPVDDLVPHHNALVHLVVTSQDGGYFAHVHPLRTSAGQFAVRLRVDRPGRYLAYAEFARADGGDRLATGQFTVDTGPPPAPSLAASPLPSSPAPASPAPVVSVSPGPPVAGQPVTIRFDVGASDLQPWLGMAGHLIIRDADGTFFGHVHEFTSMVAAPPGQQAPDDTVAGYGPVLSFTFAFPRPGRYLLWLQFSRDYRILTYPMSLSVAAPGSSR